MSGNIFNSNGTHVAVLNGAEVFDLDGQKIYELKGINLYRLSGELVGHLKQRARQREAARSLHRQAVPWQREISPNLIAEGAGKMIPIKSTDRTLTRDKRTRRDGGEAIRDRSQASIGPGPPQRASGDREISGADNCSGAPRFVLSRRNLMTL